MSAVKCYMRGRVPPIADLHHVTVATSSSRSLIGHLGNFYPGYNSELSSIPSLLLTNQALGFS